jgi:NAD(P)-dependent dehydrogenase (short-subunit alcohol dehydrogenase family)
METPPTALTTSSVTNFATSATSASTALVIGGTGGLGAALVQALQRDTSYTQVLCLGRSTAPALDYADEATLAASAQWVAAQCASAPLRTIIVATGYLHTDGAGPERTWSQLDAQYLQRVMLINAIGPALVFKHFAQQLARDRMTRMALISAKVGSIGDNSLGGWYGYRASKAALNQIVKTASIEMTRRSKLSVCIAMHPGTVATALSDPFSKTGLNVRPADVAATEILQVVHALLPAQTGGFYDYKGESLPW